MAPAPTPSAPGCARMSARERPLRADSACRWACAASTRPCAYSAIAASISGAATSATTDDCCQACADDSAGSRPMRIPDVSSADESTSCRALAARGAGGADAAAASTASGTSRPPAAMPAATSGPSSRNEPCVSAVH